MFEMSTKMFIQMGLLFGSVFTVRTLEHFEPAVHQEVSLQMFIGFELVPAMLTAVSSLVRMFHHVLS